MTAKIDEQSLPTALKSGGHALTAGAFEAAHGLEQNLGEGRGVALTAKAGVSEGTLAEVPRDVVGEPVGSSKKQDQRERPLEDDRQGDHRAEHEQRQRDAAARKDLGPVRDELHGGGTFAEPDPRRKTQLPVCSAGDTVQVPVRKDLNV